MNRARLNQWVEVKAGFTVDDRAFLPGSLTVTVIDPAGNDTMLGVSLVTGNYYSGQLQLAQEGTWEIISRGIGTYVDGNGRTLNFDETTTQTILVV